MSFLFASRAPGYRQLVAGSGVKSESTPAIETQDTSPRSHFESGASSGERNPDDTQESSSIPVEQRASDASTRAYGTPLTSSSAASSSDVSISIFNSQSACPKKVDPDEGFKETSVVDSTKSGDLRRLFKAPMGSSEATSSEDRKGQASKAHSVISLQEQLQLPAACRAKLDKHQKAMASAKRWSAIKMCLFICLLLFIAVLGIGDSVLTLVEYLKQQEELKAAKQKAEIIEGDPTSISRHMVMNMQHQAAAQLTITSQESAVLQKAGQGRRRRRRR